MPEKKKVWVDAAPNQLLVSAFAALGYLFFWGTELLLLYWLAQELIGRTQFGFMVAGAIVLFWTVVCAFVTLRFRKLVRPQSVLFLTDKSIGATGRNAFEIHFADVEKILVTHDGDGFAAQITAQETQVSALVRDRKGFLEACKQIPALNGRVGTAGVID